jgi:hypothetical protein
MPAPADAGLNLKMKVNLTQAQRKITFCNEISSCNFYSIGVKFSIRCS